jgi:hypothetical protein
MLEDRTTEAALNAMSADELRALIRDIIPWLDESTHGRLVNALVDRAARNPSGWTPQGPTDAVAADIVAFADAAKRVGYSDPGDVDEYLRQGAHAFLARDYRAAFRIFRALLIPVGNVDIDLGQHEMLDEVLGVDVARCAMQYVVSVYMTASPRHRGKAVLSAIDDVQAIGHFWEPLQEMERVVVEPLPEFPQFLAQWRSLVEERSVEKRGHDWDSDEDRWLHEVVQRVEGPGGLARIARATRRTGDLRAWCRALVDVRDWKSALAAFDEAAGLVASDECSQGEFLDGAALAAQELARKDLPRLLERAWREAPDMVRLRRWLGSSRAKKVLRQRVTEALSACPKKAHRQRALLHVLDGDFAAAAKLLAAAPGLGWSNRGHPGHLLFPLFVSLLGDVEFSGETTCDYDESDVFADREEPRLSTPEIVDLLELAKVTAPDAAKFRVAMIKAMRKAAEKRIAGVTENKRRRHYGHAASLALACAQIDESAETTRWLTAIRDGFRRYPALQRELSQHGYRS